MCTYALHMRIWLKSGRFVRQTSLCTPMSVFHAVFCGGGTQWVVLSAAAAKNRVKNAKCGTGRRPSHAPTAVRGTADGTRRSTVGTLNMGTWAGTGEALAWDIASDVPSTSPSQGSNSGAHRESYSTHTYAFKRSCAHDSCNEPTTVNTQQDGHTVVGTESPRFSATKVKGLN